MRLASLRSAQFTARLDSPPDSSYQQRQHAIEHYTPALMQLVTFLPSLHAYPSAIMLVKQPQQHGAGAGAGADADTPPPEFLQKYENDIRPPIADTIVDICRLVGAGQVLTALGGVLSNFWGGDRNKNTLLGVEATVSLIGVVAGGNFVSDDDSTGVARKCVEIALQVRNYPLPPSTTKVIPHLTTKLTPSRYRSPGAARGCFSIEQQQHCSEDL